MLLTGCVKGDFGRARPSLAGNNMHSWAEIEAVGSISAPAARSSLNDDERELRDLALPLMQALDRDGYSRELMARPYRSPAARYARLIDDIRNDGTRIEPFFMTARHVLDMDSKRAQSLSYIPDLQEAERANALTRISENHLVIGSVHRSLTERAGAFRYALERLVIANPSPMAVEAERALNRLRMQIEKNRLVAMPD